MSAGTCRVGDMSHSLYFGRPTLAESCSPILLKKIELACLSLRTVAHNFRFFIEFKIKHDIFDFFLYFASHIGGRVPFVTLASNTRETGVLTTELPARPIGFSLQLPQDAAGIRQDKCAFRD